MSALDKILRMVRPTSKNGNAGESPAAESAEAIAAALAELVAERSQAQAVIADVHERREGLLLTVGSDAQIAELDKQVDAATLVVERCDAAEPLLTSRLLDAQAADRRAIFDDIRETYEATVHLFADSARQAHRHRALLIRIRDTAAELGYRDEAELLLRLPHVHVMSSAAGVSDFELSATTG